MCFTDLGNRKIPEIFLLWIFRAMGMALYSLESGLEFDRTNLRPPTHHGWTPLIHRDIKPANIFIRRPETDGGYPLPVLADFDLAVLAPNGRAIPEDMGTIGFKPPVSQGAFVRQRSRFRMIP